MKTFGILGSVLTLVFVIPITLHAQSAGNQKMRDTATHDQLSQSLRMVQQRDPIHDLGPAIGKTEEDPSKPLASRDLIKDSTILCYRGYLTLVPKRAVLHLPEALKDRFEAKDKVKVVSWNGFFQVNRGWIRAVEVTREQAMGQAPMSEEVVKSFQEGNSAVIATFKGGPISVLPYVAPETPKEGETAPANPKESPLAAAQNTKVKIQP
jgi:hypothetical protein